MQKATDVDKVLIAVLTMGTVRWELAKALTVMVWNRAQKQDMAIQIEYYSGKPISHNRNQIVKDFMVGDFDFLLMIDDDQAPIGDDPLELVRLNKAIVGLPTPIYNEVKNPDNPIAWNVGRDSEQGNWDLIQLEDVGLVEVDAVGTGIMLIARRVLEHPAMRAPFMDKFDEDGIRIQGLDFLFCRRAREAGFKVYVHTKYLSEHFVELPVLRAWRARQASRNGTPVMVEQEVISNGNTI